MKDHNSRKNYIFKDALPNENSEEYKKIISFLEKRSSNNPRIERESRKRYIQAVNSLTAQDLSTSGLLTSTTIRHFLREFNTRSWKYGLRSVPILFNILESFFNYDKNIIYFELLEEEEYVLSLFDFLDYATLNSFTEKKDLINKNVVENLIYHFNVGADLNSITFKTEDGKEFVIGGVSLVRRGSEITVLMITGLICDTKKIIFSNEDFEPTPGKENLNYNPEKEERPVLLNENPQYWKTLLVCRFDLNSETIDARYIAKELTNSFNITTDDISGFLNQEGEFINESFEEIFKDNLEGIENFSSLFEVGKLCLYLPYYLNLYEDYIIAEDHDTEFKRKINKPLHKRKFRHVPDKFKHIIKEVYILNIENKFAPDRLKIREDLFNVETTGYWKKINPDEIGMDKNGNQISGKTWIHKTISWFQAKNDEINVSNNRLQEFDSENAGIIYILRNPAMEDNIFKIGLTTKSSDKRAKQLSKTSIPDKFYKMNEWNVRDCYKAEKEVHLILNEYRVDPRREFFRLPMELAVKVISEVITKINNHQ